MDWAINSKGEHVKAGTSGAYGFYLRCPVCKLPVHHRRGSHRRPHFAHSRMNYNRECELYHPGTGVKTASTTATNKRLQLSNITSSLKSLKLIWRDGEPIPASLALQIPYLPADNLSTLTINSTLGQQSFTCESCTKTTLAQVALHVPPASSKLTPSNQAFEIELNAVLNEFKTTGNFFRITVNGGVLERRNTPLQLGKEYFLITQQQLSLSLRPCSLKLTEEPRTYRDWTTYRLKLRNLPRTQETDIIHLGKYLGREIVPAQPTVNIIWPLPNQFDPDGTHVYDTAISQLIVRSDFGLPNCEPDDINGCSILALGKCLYRINFSDKTREAIIWLNEGSIRKLRFDNIPIMQPEGVNLKIKDMIFDLYNPSINEISQSIKQFEVLVPSERLWRRIRINNLPLRTLANGRTHKYDAQLLSLNAEAFGNIQTTIQTARVISKQPWHSKLDALIIGNVGQSASKQLVSVHTKAQLIRWAINNDAQRILPVILSAFSSR